MEENNELIIEERKKKLIAMFKENKWFTGYSIIVAISLIMIILSASNLIAVPVIHWVILGIIGLAAGLLTYFNKGKYSLYLFVIWPVWIATYIRTRNLGGLRDITTGGWTLGPDLDPFLFLRWAKYIVEHGSLMSMDTLRYVPLGFDTKGELILLPYMISWFHYVASWFGSASIEQSAALFPVFMFAITIISFFLLTKEVLIKSENKNIAIIISFVASLFLAVSPIILPRTIAGIPEKESAAFFFMFLALYLFLRAWREDKTVKRILIILGSSIATACMALIWGGYAYLFVTIGLVVFIMFLLGNVERKDIMTYALWIILSFLFMMPFSTRYSLENIIYSTVTLIMLFILALGIFHSILFKTRIKDKLDKIKIIKNLPPILVSLVILVVLSLVVCTVVFGTGFIADKIGDVTKSFVKPVTSRLGVTVAENKQPYYNEWGTSFGPFLQGVPLLLWFFIFGTVYLLYNSLKSLYKKDKIVISAAYFIFLLAIVFSRYSPSSILNGENTLSLLVYFGGFVILGASVIHLIWRYNRKGNLELIKEVPIGPIMIFSLLFFTLVSARLAIRLIMVLVPAASILAAYFIIKIGAISVNYIEKKESSKRSMGIIALVLIISFGAFILINNYNASEASAKGYAPYIYTFQWQKAMSWVRDSTPNNAVFGHWWDYGYWVQTIGQRATALDGGNAISYWNHLMGRYSLTGASSKESAEFLYAHNVTHFLIDSSDIGKYTAFASIGSDKNYDRRSWINTFLRDDKQTVELKNKTRSVYMGGFSLDEDLIDSINGTRIFLPGLGNQDINKAANLAGLGAIVIEIDSNKQLNQPKAIFIYQNKQYDLPLRYAFYQGRFIDFGSGVEAGIFLIPTVEAGGNGEAIIQDTGALMYLSRRVVKSQLARLYLYGEEDEYFKLAHNEPDLFISNLRAQGVNVSDFVYYQGIRGPIKIWAVSYPDIEFKPEYIVTQYPADISTV